MSTPPPAQHRFFRFDVRDVSARDGWADGTKFEGRAEDYMINVERHDGSPPTYYAVLRNGATWLIDAEGGTVQHALDLLQSKVRLLRTKLESLTAP